MTGQETGLLTESLEAETSLNEDHRDWASLPLPVVDSLVRVLKDARRWRLEGRSLRLINRHWSAAVTMHVEEIRPDTTRIIVDEDIASLSKFKRVTSVDISPFLTHPLKHAIPRNRKQKKLFLKNWYCTKLERVVDVLCQMPELTQIEVGLKASVPLLYHCPIAGEQLSRLGRITSAYIYHTDNLRLNGKPHLNATSLLYAGSPFVDFTKGLAEFINSLNGLDTLETTAGLLSCVTQFDFLKKVNHVTLQNMDFCLCTPEALSWATISSAILHSSQSSILDSVVLLDRVQSLSLESPSVDSLERISLARFARHLKALRLDVWHPDVSLDIPVETLSRFEQLECLELESYHFDGASLKENLPNLKALRVHYCTVKDGDVTFVTRFHKLELLSWKKVYDPANQLLQLPLDKPMPPKLRSLSLIPISDDSELVSISRQTNLEVLLFGTEPYDFRAGNISKKGVEALERLQNLRILTIVSSGERNRETLLRSLPVNLVTGLEQLWLDMPLDYITEDESDVKSIERRSPNLIVKSRNMTCWSSFSKTLDHAWLI